MGKAVVLALQKTAKEKKCTKEWKKKLVHTVLNILKSVIKTIQNNDGSFLWKYLYIVVTAPYSRVLAMRWRRRIRFLASLPFTTYPCDLLQVTPRSSHLSPRWCVCDKSVIIACLIISVHYVMYYPAFTMRWQHYELWALLACVRFINASFINACRIRVTQAIIAAITAKTENLYPTATVAVEREIIITFLCHQTQQPTYLHQQLSDDRVFPPFLRGLHDGVPAGLLVLQGLGAHRELHLPWRKQGSASPAGQSRGNGVCICAGRSLVRHREVFPRGELNSRQCFIFIQLQPSRPPPSWWPPEQALVHQQEE